jgi:hypothetical protein
MVPHYAYRTPSLQKREERHALWTQLKYKETSELTAGGCEQRTSLTFRHYGADELQWRKDEILTVTFSGVYFSFSGF